MESTENHTEGVISMTEIKIPLDASLVQSLLSSETEGVQRLLKQVLEAILEARATDIAGAGRYERSEDRKCQRNGYREKWITFRIGRLKIRIPLGYRSLFQVCQVHVMPGKGVSGPIL
jgi:transposase-like protein